MCELAERLMNASDSVGGDRQCVLDKAVRLRTGFSGEPNNNTT